MNTTAEMESAGKYIYEKGIIFDNLDQILFLTIFYIQVEIMIQQIVRISIQSL